MPRSLVGVALATLLVAAGGHAQPPGFPGGGNFPRGPSFPNNPAMPGGGVPNPGFPPAIPGGGFPAAGPEANGGTCSSCKRDFTWAGGTASAPKRCPHCGVRFGYVDNDDGTRTNLATGKTVAKLPLWIGAPLAVLGVAVVVGVVAARVIHAARPGSGKKSRKKKPRRRAVIDDGEEDDDAPPPRRDRRSAGGKPVPMATLAEDDGGFEVIGDAPPAEPPRRAKPKLLPPDGGPR